MSDLKPVKKGGLEGAPFFPALPPAIELLAADELSKGKSLAEICAAVKEKVTGNPSLLGETTAEAQEHSPSPEAPPNEDEGFQDWLRSRYLKSYLRIVTGQIDGLDLEELDDCAQCCVMPAVNFETWKKRKGVPDA